MVFSIVNLLPFFLCSTTVLSQSSPTVLTNNGLIEGRDHSVGSKLIHSFLGIPFAEPPLGDLRFKRPIPKNSWNGTYIASELKPQCIQTKNTSLMAEDCLYLNIWSPNLNTSANSSVMLYIYGGGFYSGAATRMDNGNNYYDGKQLASKEVIVVTVNYRLGIFGFLVGDSDDEPGNIGLWDQVMALNWTIQNIRAFGGNPDDITLFGHSSGSISISCLIVSPVTKNWFNKAIMQSGSGLYGKIPLERKTALNFSKDFAKNNYYFPKNPCIDDNKWIQCLKNKSSQELLAAQFIYKSITKIESIFNPIFGDKLMPKNVVKSIKDGDFRKDIKLFIGHTEMEGLQSMMAFDEKLKLSNRYNPMIAFVSNISKSIIYNDLRLIFNGFSVRDRIASAYTDPFPDCIPNLYLMENKIRKSASHAYGDMAFTCPTILFGAKIVNDSTFSGKVYQYRLTYTYSKSSAYGSVWAEVTHPDDRALIFGRPFNEKYYNWTADDEKLSAEMMDIWTYFARNGSPPLVKGKQWPEYRSSFKRGINLSYVELNPDPSYGRRIHINKYKGEDGYHPSVINNCIGFWDQILSQEI